MKPKSKILWKIILVIALSNFVVLNLFLPSSVYAQEPSGLTGWDCMKPWNWPTCIKDVAIATVTMITSKLGEWFNWSLSWALEAFLRIAGFFMQIAGKILDWAIDFNLNPQTFNPAGPLQPGTDASQAKYGGDFIFDNWKILRDTANLLFVFFLLAIAIATIVGWETYGMKSALLTLVMMALLINFSLLLTRYPIEFSNSLAEYFIGKQGKLSDIKNRLAFETDTASSTITISGMVLHGLSPHQIYKTASITSEAGSLELTQKITLGAIMGIVLVLTAAMVFFAAAVLLFMRVAMLWFLMILSPIAFLMYAFPATAGYGRTWLNWLFNQAFFFPVFAFFLFVAVSFTSQISTEGVAAKDISEASSSTIGFVAKYILGIMMFLIALSLAKSMAGKSGEAATSFGEKAKNWALKKSGKIMQSEGGGIRRLGESVEKAKEGKNRVTGVVLSTVGRTIRYAGGLTNLAGRGTEWLGGKKKKKGGGGGGGGGGGNEAIEEAREEGKEEAREEGRKRARPEKSYIEAAVREGPGIIGRMLKRGLGIAPKTSTK